ncbi:MAG: sugar phosphate isomerase/epimerase [Gammaproteobacteria bacterium]|uniref:sugar phosphate isomerase/epimerase family protein n=1 Tax=Pseudomaricurvus alcaniphilus TaxID=1166482 RepID=UPI0014086134|nr:sugar phosphate isomerase/epimerase [Pseudomaricurvus alcaniphilus]MBR9911808.1 sugar phosphate isomerase/epimerase [Gammaproteobacteria bacterium]NHN39237.1 sugar phosphate isomerase/epimerase [Pseudomaricurvus alcaniphilus]
MNKTICSYFTHAGNVNPFAANSASPVDFQRRARACADAGFGGMGFSLDDINQLLARHGAAEVNRILDDLDLQQRELEVLLDWFVDGERRQVSDLKRQQLLLAAELIGAHHIKVCSDITGKPWPMDHLIGEFYQLCQQAAAVDTAITIELFPTSNLADLQSGLAVVQGAGCSNGGLLLDIWHMLRGNISLDAIASLPAGIINHVELDDGPLLPGADYITDTIEHRCAPGEGEFPIAKFMAAIAATGYQGLYGVEILSNEFRSLAVEQAAQRAYRGMAHALQLG